MCGLYKGMKDPSRNYCQIGRTGRAVAPEGGCGLGPRRTMAVPGVAGVGCVGRVWWRVAVQAVLGLYEGLQVSSRSYRQMGRTGRAVVPGEERIAGWVRGEGSTRYFDARRGLGDIVLRRTIHTCVYTALCGPPARPQAGLWF